MKIKILKYPSYEDYEVLSHCIIGYKEGYNNYQNYDINAREIILGELRNNSYSFGNFESLNFTFYVEGISRACTHQLVRTRIGAGYSQESMRYNEIESDREIIIPKTYENMVFNTDIGPILYPTVLSAFHKSMELYQRLLDAGVPAQDARYILPEGISTHIYLKYSYPALVNVFRQRMCKLVQWEIRNVFLEIREQFEAIIRSMSSKSGSDKGEHEILKALVSKFYLPCETGGECNRKDAIFPSCGHSQVDELYSNDVNANHF